MIFHHFSSLNQLLLRSFFARLQVKWKHPKERWQLHLPRLKLVLIPDFLSNSTHFRVNIVWKKENITQEGYYFLVHIIRVISLRVLSLILRHFTCDINHAHDKWTQKKSGALSMKIMLYPRISPGSRALFTGNVNSSAHFLLRTRFISHKQSSEGKVKPNYFLTFTSSLIHI